eukprot:1146013-Pelagomonas_calceolata.AAC.4
MSIDMVCRVKRSTGVGPKVCIAVEQCTLLIACCHAAVLTKQLMQSFPREILPKLPGFVSLQTPKRRMKIGKLCARLIHQLGGSHEAVSAFLHQKVSDDWGDKEGESSCAAQRNQRLRRRKGKERDT